MAAHGCISRDQSTSFAKIFCWFATDPALSGLTWTGPDKRRFSIVRSRLPVVTRLD